MHALSVMDSASAHISPVVLATFRVAGVKYAIIPGGLISFIQAIDVALAALYRACHHQPDMEVIERRGKVTAAEAHNLFVELSYKDLKAASEKINVPTLFKSLGYLNPVEAKLCVPYQLNPLVDALPDAAEGFNAPAAKAKPKAGPKQMSISDFRCRR